ncbi:hypothetical protein RFI_04301 [Reticulomyxa filosa]|uniref:Uncharacterized protein n=1 Tax=Reticulomyxa filosa TaxID=46433 RepID=X6P2M7_RETFI|nr:hypothetical protein RFI_04301 [Reticulomyxa filosa]|eukprot:ETO32815.1 hypothetical protein RFI_04301 [Reticulomyxa filosa]
MKILVSLRKMTLAVILFLCLTLVKFPHEMRLGRKVFEKKWKCDMVVEFGNPRTASIFLNGFAGYYWNDTFDVILAKGKRRPSTVVHLQKQQFVKHFIFFYGDEYCTSHSASGFPRGGGNYMYKKKICFAVFRMQYELRKQIQDEGEEYELVVYNYWNTLFAKSPKNTEEPVYQPLFWRQDIGTYVSAPQMWLTWNNNNNNNDNNSNNNNNNLLPSSGSSTSFKFAKFFFSFFFFFYYLSIFIFFGKKKKK